MPNFGFFSAGNRSLSTARAAGGNSNRLAARTTQNRYPDLATQVPVQLIKPGVSFSRDGAERLTACEYIRHYNGFMDTRRFQLVPAMPDKTISFVTTTTGDGRSERRQTQEGSFERRLQHMSNWCFDGNGNEQVDTVCDIPFYRDRDEHDMVDGVMSIVKEILATQAVNGRFVPRYSTWRNVPVSLFTRYHLCRFMTNPRRWGRDLETEHRVRLTRSLCIAGFNVEFWDMPTEDRDSLFVPIRDSEWTIYDLSVVLTVPTPTTLIYFGNHLINIRHDLHHLTHGVNYDPARFLTINQDLRTIAAAEHLYMAFGRFCVTALFGAAYGFNDSGLYTNWNRFVGVLTPVTPAMREFVAHHGIRELLRGTGLPHDLVRMALERSVAIDWDTARNTGTWDGGDVYFRYDPYLGDIDDLLNRYGGDKMMNETLQGAPVSFLHVAHVNQLKGADWYRYEAIREWGEDSVRFDFRITDHALDSPLDDNRYYNHQEPVLPGGQQVAAASPANRQSMRVTVSVPNANTLAALPATIVDRQAIETEVRATVLTEQLALFRHALANGGVLPADVDDPEEYATERLTTWENLLEHYQRTLGLLVQSRLDHTNATQGQAAATANAATQTQRADTAEAARAEVVTERDNLIAERDRLREEVARLNRERNRYEPQFTGITHTARANLARLSRDLVSVHESLRDEAVRDAIERARDDDAME